MSIDQQDREPEVPQSQPQATAGEQSLEDALNEVYEAAGSPSDVGDFDIESLKGQGWSGSDEEPVVPAADVLQYDAGSTVSAAPAEATLGMLAGSSPIQSNDAPSPSNGDAATSQNVDLIAEAAGPKVALPPERQEDEDELQWRIRRSREIGISRTGEYPGMQKQWFTLTREMIEDYDREQLAKQERENALTVSADGKAPKDQLMDKLMELAEKEPIEIRRNPKTGKAALDELKISDDGGQARERTKPAVDLNSALVGMNAAEQNTKPAAGGEEESVKDQKAKDDKDALKGKLPYPPGGGGGGFSLPTFGIGSALQRMGAAAAAAPGTLKSGLEARRNRPDALAQRITRAVEDAHDAHLNYIGTAKKAGVMVETASKPTKAQTDAIVRFAGTAEGALVTADLQMRQERIKRLFSELVTQHPNALSDPRFTGGEKWLTAERSIKELARATDKTYALGSEGKVEKVSSGLKKIIEMIAERISMAIEAVVNKIGLKKSA